LNFAQVLIAIQKQFMKCDRSMKEKRFPQ